MDLLILLVLLGYASRKIARRNQLARQHAREDFSWLPYLAAKELFPRLLAVWEDDPGSHQVSRLAEEFVTRVRLCETWCPLGQVTVSRAFKLHTLKAMLEDAWGVELALPEGGHLRGSIPLYALAATKRQAKLEPFPAGRSARYRAPAYEPVGIGTKEGDGRLPGIA